MKVDRSNFSRTEINYFLASFLYEANFFLFLSMIRYKNSHRETIADCQAGLINLDCRFELSLFESFSITGQIQWRHDNTP